MPFLVSERQGHEPVAEGVVTEGCRLGFIYFIIFYFRGIVSSGPYPSVVMAVMHLLLDATRQKTPKRRRGSSHFREMSSMFTLNFYCGGTSLFFWR